MANRTPTATPAFGTDFSAAFRELVLWRRDVRRFRPDAVEAGLVQSLIELASHSPSVGNCQPWRFVLVEDGERRGVVAESFRRANADALQGYTGEKQAL